jgi:hypothetical protein
MLTFAFLKECCSLTGWMQLPWFGRPRKRMDFLRARQGGYTSSMDAVRFGRALGFGARHAVKTLTTAVDAATAENPTSKISTPRTNTGQPGGPVPQTQEARGGGYTELTASAARAAKVERVAAQPVARRRGAKQAVRQGGKRFCEAAWSPFVRLSGVVVLEVAGLFFGIFALYGLNTVWRLHGQWRRGAPGNRQLIGGVAMLAIFGYFCVSSFVRARRRERRR